LIFCETRRQEGCDIQRQRFVVDDFIQHQGAFRMLWPSSKHRAPKLRVFIDFMVAELFKAGNPLQMK